VVAYASVVPSGWYLTPQREHAKIDLEGKMGKRKNKPLPNYITCAHCGKQFEYTDYMLLCDNIMQHKPACSYDCNKALGQAK
jgi:hypothetical protein